MASRFCIGQRWVSESEPELGLGKIVAFDNRFVELEFGALKIRRKYSAGSAPLRRIVFKKGDLIENSSGAECRVDAVEQTNEGFIIYRCPDRSIGEDQLSDTINFSAPDKRLLNGITDTPADFNLRFEMLAQQAVIRQSEVRGFVGGRIDLIPHQLFIADIASSHRMPRVLLSDETGLGKTIEACLIAHRLIMSGRAQRVLILVPEALVHQWFVELLRKFNHSFRIFTEEFGGEVSKKNPFSEEQQFICSADLLLREKKFFDAAINAGWDLVIVDEAHHMRLNSPSFLLLEQLSSKTKGLILLSATPEQYGRKDHFARLQLLDPKRFISYDAYLEQLGRLQLLSDYIDNWIIEKNVDLSSVSSEDVQILLPKEIRSLLPDYRAADSGSQSVTLSQLVDIYAVGRVQFRNTRRTIKGFPERKVTLVPVDGGSGYHEQLKNEMLGDVTGSKTQISIQSDDPRIKAIVKLLQENPESKFLIICTTIDKVVCIQNGLQKHLAIDIAIFHEDMTLIQADRNAAWFSEKNGARVLISSDIGSEGRNLQFCSHLILFDLPFNPELLEQRIGRLDRIGQKSVINLYFIYLNNSPQHLLCRWYFEGVCSLQKNVPAAGAVFEELKPQLQTMLLKSGSIAANDSNADELITHTRLRCTQLTEELFSKRDRLLEIASFQQKRAAELVHSIEYEDVHDRAENVMEKLFRHYGIALEDAGENRWELLTDYLTDHAFPLPRQERPVITYNRKTALFRDDIEFLTIDHPMVGGALDLFLSSEHGSSAFGLWPDPNRKELVLDCIYILECIAATELNSDRFLPPIPLRVAINHLGKEVTSDYLPAKSAGFLKKGSIKPLLSNEQLSSVIIPSMLEKSSQVAQRAMKPLIEDALKKLGKYYDAEKSRLTRLSELGAVIAPEEFQLLEDDHKNLSVVIKDARLRLDAVCLIRRGPL